MAVGLEEAYAAADTLALRYGWRGMFGESPSLRALVALAYLTGVSDGMKETEQLAQEAFDRLAAALR